MEKPLILCGRTFLPEFVVTLRQHLEAEPAASAKAMATIICDRLAWYSANGQLALSSARVALSKLRRRGLLPKAVRPAGRRPRRRLKASGGALPALGVIPARVDAVRGLELHLLQDAEESLRQIWNDLIIAQHPCADAPLAGPRLRYLIGSEHGWLGALSVGPAAFALGARDGWIGWSPEARASNLGQVVGLSRFLIRKEVRCTHLASKVLGLALRRLPQDWQQRYGHKPLLVETFVDRERFTGLCFAAANWQRIGASTGRGRLGPKEALCSLKDIWVYPLEAQARQRLQQESPPPLLPRPLLESLAQPAGCAQELARLALKDARLTRRAQAILAARLAQPQASFFGSFTRWAQAKAAYGLIEHKKAPLSFTRLLEAHAGATLERMAAEPLILLPQDTTTLNYTGLKQTTGLGPLGEDKARGLWLHSLLALRADGVPLGVLGAQCWARPPAAVAPPTRGRNAKSIDEKESMRWVEALQRSAKAARQMPQSQLVVITDREGDLYELHDAVQVGPPNLHVLIRAQHDRLLQEHQKLWAFMAAQPVLRTSKLKVPRGHHQPPRTARIELRASTIVIEAPQVGSKKGWPPLRLHAVWVREIDAPAGLPPLDWMLLSDLPVRNAAEAWQRVQWYKQRWVIEEWHRVLKTGCNAEGREFKTAEHLTQVLAFDLIVAWRILACLKLGRAMPELPATLLYTQEELAVLCALKKKRIPARMLNARTG
jgi:Domain of unknown function (DUF4338)/Transposase DNA-binding